MNWTGGALGRSRTANGSLTAIQKAHFAKARAKQERERVNSPTLEGFTPNQWLDRNTDPAQSRWPEQRQNSQLRNVYYGGRAPSPITISSQPTSSHSSHHQTGSKERSGRNLSPAPLDKPIESFPSALELHRVRLLEMHDWVGISHTKPAKVDFTDSDDRDQIGKRRRLNSSNHHGHKSERRLYSHQRPKEKFVSASDRLSQADISIRVGSAVDRRSTKNEHSRRPVSKLDRNSSVSDEMLLDDVYSHKSGSSHSPFRLPHTAHNLYSDQVLRQQWHELTPSVFSESPDALRTNDATVQEQAGGIRITYDQTTPDQVIVETRHVPPEMQLVMRKPNGEHTPIRFAFEDTSRYSNESPNRETTIWAKPELECEEGNPVLELQTMKKAGRHKLRPTLPRLEDSRALTRNFDLIQSGIIGEKPEYNHPHNSPPLNREPTIENIPPPSDLDPVNESAFYSRQISANEEEGWRTFINHDRQEIGSIPKALTSNEAIHSSHQPRTETVEVGPVKSPARNVKTVVDEDEALWRSFVFGGDDTYQKWTVESSPEVPVPSEQQDQPTAGSAVRTQTSMEAEIATSPIKQNAHLLEQSASSSPPTSKLNKASQIALVSSTSQLTDSDEMLDGGRRPKYNSVPGDPSPMPDNSSADLNHGAPQMPSSNLVQAATSPITTIDSRPRKHSPDVPSSLAAQAATIPATPAAPSSDELSWSPSRVSQTPSHPNVVFKRPARYEGKRVSDAVETIRIGMKSRSAPNTTERKNRRDTSKLEEGSARQRAISEEQDELHEDDEIEDD